MSARTPAEQPKQYESVIQGLQDELAATNHEVMVLTLDLEQRVADRTAELAASNQQLLKEVAERRNAEAEIKKLNEELRERAGLLEVRNREVERATSRKSKFLASMSHELRTPLNAIVGFSGLLADEIPGELNEKQKRFVGHIRTGANHLLQLINDILDLSRIEAGQVDIRCEEFGVKEALPEVLSMIRPLAMAKSINLVEVLTAQRPVFADRIRFKQILYNLLSNAIKFTPKGGSVTVACAEDGGFIRVSVSDTGVGIRPEDQEMVFEEFRQVEGDSKHEGTGLGLAITRRLVELQGGKIWLESEAGKGSRFSLTLPASSTAGSETAVPPDASNAQIVDDREKPLILIVDDDGPARELLAGYLEPEGYRIAMASSAAEAMEKARQLLPAAITLDVLMPRENGFKILLNLKGNPETAEIPIVMVSVLEQQKTGFALGATDYLVKPVERSVLLTAIHKHIWPLGVPQTPVLIVDDEAAALHLVEAILRSAGYQTLTAKDGADALAILAETPVSAIVVDLMMPEMNGFELIQHAKEQPRLKDVPIFVLTAKSLTQEEITLLRRDTHALFQKDSSWGQTMVARVKELVRPGKAEARDAV
ncbi:MAG TPA: response regulator [Candidatus Angelobacter sp.]|nr:response regulator [Candidatus Angelobacter sp.]